MTLARRLVFGRDPRRTLVRVGVLGVISVVTFGWLLTPVRTEGISMRPTYESGSLNFVDHVTYHFSAPHRGDVVAIRLAGPSVVYVKRIIGLPRERVAFVDGQVQIDGRALDEPYVRYRRPWNVDEVTLGSQEYYVVGDNRGMNAADHDFGRVDGARIVGRVIF